MAQPQRRTRPRSNRPNPTAAPEAPKTPETTQNPDPAAQAPDAPADAAGGITGADLTPPAGPPESDEHNNTNGDADAPKDPANPDGAELQDADDGAPKTAPPLPEIRDNISEDELDETEFRAKWLGWLAENNIACPDGHILFPGEPMTFIGDHDKDRNVVVLNRDVFQLVLPFRSLRPTFTLVARAGTVKPQAVFVPYEEYVAATNDLTASIAF